MFAKLKNDIFQLGIYDVNKQRGAGGNLEYRLSHPNLGYNFTEAGRRGYSSPYRKVYTGPSEGFWVKASDCIRDFEVIKLEARDRKNKRK